MAKAALRGGGARGVICPPPGIWYEHRHIEAEVGSQFTVIND